MKRLWLILFIMFFGCTAGKIDYYGDSIMFPTKGFVLNKLERDPIDPDIFYLTGTVTCNNSRFVERRKMMSYYFNRIMEENGYVAYQVVNSNTGEDYSITVTWCYLAMEVRFSKSMEDFEKWNKIYKN